MAHTMLSKMDAKMQQAIRHNTECANICSETFSHCIQMGGKHADPEHIKTLIDCSEICRISAAFMLRESAFSAELCRLNAKVCDSCAESCTRIDAGDETMKQCAEACRSCAESCKQMAEM